VWYGSKEGGSLKRIILSATVVALTAAMIAVSSLASSAQEEGGQYASDGQYAPGDQYAAPAAQSTVICAPWSKSWDISKGRWVYTWYRWCVDTSLYDPSVESSWYIEWGDTVRGEQANLCPESGSCTVSGGGGNLQMSSSSEPVADNQTFTDTPAGSTSPADTQAPPASTPTGSTNPEDTQTTPASTY
jgi:hypothetical protein